MYRDEQSVLRALYIAGTKLKNAFKDKQDKCKNELINIMSILDNISPLKVLQRGYSVVSNTQGVINSVKQVEVDDVVRITMSDGKVYASITRKDDKDGQ